MRHYYRIYGELDASDLTPMGSVNKIMKEFGFDERLCVWVENPIDISSIRKLTQEESDLLLKTINEDVTYKARSIEYLGMREDEETI